MKKIYLKYIGNILTILAIIFLINRIIKLDVDYKNIFNIKNSIILFNLSLLYSLHILMCCLPWKLSIEIVTNKKIDFYEVSEVFTKANLMKYIPGNVFQYVGRNDIAIKKEISHIKIVISTILDILMNIIGMGIISIIFYRRGIEIWVNYLNIPIIKILIVFITGVFIILVIFRVKIYNIIDKIKPNLSARKIKLCFYSILYYIASGIYTGIFYLIILKVVVDMDFSFKEAITILGAYSLSWIIGFIMPGAPGGIGVREVAITVFLSNIVNIDQILLGIIIYRFITIIGDFLGLFLTKIYRIFKKYGNRGVEEI